MNISKLSKTQQNIMKSMYYALLHSDSKLVDALWKGDYEETCSGSKPTLELNSCGISDTITISNQNCMPKEYYDNL